MAELDMGPRAHLAPSSAPRMSLLGLRVAALAILGFSLWVVFASLQIPRGGGFVVIGPRFFPLVVGCVLVALAVLFLLSTTIRPDWFLIQKATEEGSVTSWKTVGIMVGVLSVYAFALDFLGYVIATAVLFLVLSRLLGSRKLLRDSFIAIVLSLTIYLTFTEFLGVRLPGGWFF